MCNTKSRRNVIVAALLLAAMLLTMCGISSASYADAGKSASVTIDGIHKVDNKDTLKTGRHTFTLKAKDVSYPMPEGARLGEKKVVISSNQEFSFGSIEFSKPGTYEYTVSREIIPSQTLRLDESVYHVTVTATNNGDATVIYTKDGENGKADKIVYTDSFVEPEDQKYTLTYVLHGGTLEGQTGGVIKEKYSKGEMVTIKDAPVKEGYRFEYWKGSRYYPGDRYEVVEDHTFEAIYSKVESDSNDSAVTSDDKDDNSDKSKKEIKSKAVKTGDAIRIGLLAAVMLACAGMIVFLIIRRRKDKK